MQISILSSPLGSATPLLPCLLFPINRRSDSIQWSLIWDASHVTIVLFAFWSCLSSLAFPLLIFCQRELWATWNWPPFFDSFAYSTNIYSWLLGVDLWEWWHLRNGHAVKRTCGRWTERTVTGRYAKPDCYVILMRFLAMCWRENERDDENYAWSGRSGRVSWSKWIILAIWFSLERRFN